MMQTVQITGMSCTHCAARVQKTLETLTQGVVVVDLKQQTATTKSHQTFDLKQIKIV